MGWGWGGGTNLRFHLSTHASVSFQVYTVVGDGCSNSLTSLGNTRLKAKARSGFSMQTVICLLQLFSLRHPHLGLVLFGVPESVCLPLLLFVAYGG